MKIWSTCHFKPVWCDFISYVEHRRCWTEWQPHNLKFCPTSFVTEPKNEEKREMSLSFFPPVTNKRVRTDCWRLIDSVTIYIPMIFLLMNLVLWKWNIIGSVINRLCSSSASYFGQSVCKVNKCKCLNVSRFQVHLFIRVGITGIFLPSL